MTESFPFIELKKKAKTLSLKALASELRDTVVTVASGGIADNEYLIGYSLPLGVIKGNPDEPWNLAPPRISDLKKLLLSTRDCSRLDSVFDLTQGVTPGGFSLSIYILRSPNEVESAVLSPAVEAEDIVDWKLAPPMKWLLYPYSNDGKAVNLGKLDYDLEPEAAQKKIDALIATGTILYPKAARYLVGYYERLASREAEKRSWKDHGKEWYEYHRPRDPEQMRSYPKIVTRRMTHNIEFSLDEEGFVPTDGCMALTFKKDNEWLKRALGSGLSQLEALLFCLALLNSSLLKLLLKSSADAWQGGFLQVREDSIGGFPLKAVRKGSLNEVRAIVRLIQEGLKSSTLRTETEIRILRLYGLELESSAISEYANLSTA